jgi:hypothetical protein
MFKNLMHDMMLSVQSRTGITTSFIICLCIIAIAGVTGFAFLCVAGYDWFAILERAARAHAPSWLLDPRVLATAVQIGREFGWQRIIPVALVGFMAAQWARDRRQQGQDAGE